jgi:hypothetical protein
MNGCERAALGIPYLVETLNGTPFVGGEDE